MIRLQNSYGYITPQATTVIQCKLDVNEIIDRRMSKDNTQFVFYKMKYDTDFQHHSIAKGELVFQKTFQGYTKNSILNNAVPVVSSLHGYYVRDDTNFPKQLEEFKQQFLLHKSIRFIGQSLHDAKMIHESANMYGQDGMTQITVRTSGTTSILNNGPCTFKVGDIVMWDFPDTKYDARCKNSGEKHSLIVVKYEPFLTCTNEVNRRDISTQTYQRTVLNMINKYKSIGGDKDVLIFMMNMHEELERHKIGIALNEAKPNEQLDLLMSR